MRLAECLSDEHFIRNIRSSDRYDILFEISSVAESRKLFRSSFEMAEALLNRESLGSTAIGGGVAIPHAKIHMLEKPLVMVGLREEGASFGLEGGDPVRIFFVILAPDEDVELHLQLLSRVARLVKFTDFNHRIFEANTPQEMYQIFLEEEENI